jgi:hypothetical protein
MKTALPALVVLVLVPALAFADDPKPYVLQGGRAVMTHSNTSTSGTASHAVAAKTPSPPVAAASHPGISAGAGSSGRAAAGAATGRPAARAASRSRGRRGAAGPIPAGGTAPGGGTGGTTSSQDSPPPYAAPGAMIRTAGQPPVYSNPGNGGTHSIEGGGFIAIDDRRAQDVARGPGVSWAPPDSKQGANAASGGGIGSAITANPGTNPLASPPTAPRTDGGHSGDNGSRGGTGFDPSF